MSNMFNGVPIDNEAAVALDYNIILFIKSDVLYTYNGPSNTTSSSPLQNSFPEIPTGLTAWLIGAGSNNIHNDNVILILCSDGNYYYYNFTITNGIPTFVFSQIKTQQAAHAAGSWHWGWLGIDTAVNTEEVNTGSLYTKGGSMYLWSGGTNYWANYPSGQGDVMYNGSLKLGEVAYGGTGQPFEGLPHSLDSIFSLPNNTTAYAFKGSMYYVLSIVSQSHTNGVQAIIGGTVVDSGSFGGALLGGAMSNIFNGVPWDHSASVSFDADPTITYFFRMNPSTNLNEVFIHDELSNTTTVSDIGIPAMFPSVSTTYPIRMGGENLGGPNPDEHLICWIDTTIPNPNRLTTVVTSPTAVVVQQFAQSDNLVYHEGQSIVQASTGDKWYAHFSYDRWLALRGSTQHFLSTGSYGGVGQPYAGLPYIGGGVGVETNYCSLLRVNGQENQMYLFTPTGDAIIMDLLAQQISSTVPYGPIAPSAPPTPLPDMLVTYNAPGDFAYFANDVSLVTETQYGWNFTKTILNADKMELYLYFVQPGNPIFYYNELLELTVNMKNNLVMGTGNLFFNVYTVGTAGGWYGTKTTYFGNPDLGTTSDLNLVETIINISDSRTDQILAISFGSNSAQQQVNLDVENVSFNVLVPATNNTQRVKVKLQNTFIAVDDKYWNLDQTANGYTANTLTAGPTWEIKLINPNIIAGNYPQTATFSQADSGTAWYLKDTFTNWTTTDNITWTNSGDTVDFTNSPGQPGIASNGAAYPKCNGLTTNTGTWPTTPNQPIGWFIDDNNLLSVRYAIGGKVKNYSKLSDLPTPNNFTPAQIESGCFASSETGTDINVLISFGQPPSTMTSLVFDKPGTMTINSETEMLIRRDWELADTLYSIDVAKPNSLKGQYFDPAFSIAFTPDNYVMPGNWSVLAEDSFRFEILFSGGLNNSLPAVNQNARQMTVTPTPSNATLTFTWTANYYTAGDVLISPVLNITTTGLVSSFITGGSLKPANAAYILYGCTSSENVDAFTSIVFIEPEPITLQFSGGNSNNISVGGNYNVTALPNDSQSTYTFTARFYSKTDVDLGLVPGATTTANQSSFTIDYATLPANVGYIYYTCKAFGGGPQDQSETALTINIEQIAPPFILTFQTANNQILTDGTYTVSPNPSKVVQYDAVFRDLAGASLGAVPGFDVSGTSSSFTITYATLPATVAWIDYQATDGTDTAQLSITIVPQQVPPEPPTPGTTTVSAFNNSNSFINHINYNILESHKKMNHRNLTELELKLLDENNKVAFSSTPIYYELEIKYNGSIF